MHELFSKCFLSDHNAIYANQMRFKAGICNERLPDWSSETVKQPVLFYALVWFSLGPHTLIGRGKSPFRRLRSRRFVSAWVLDLRKNTGWFAVEKVPFLWSTIYPANFGKKKKKNRTPRVSTLYHQSLSCFFFFFLTFDKTISYWILGSLRSNILVPYTQLAIEWFTQMTKTLKTLPFF